MGMSFDAASGTDGRWQGFRLAQATEMRPLPMRSALTPYRTSYIRRARAIANDSNHPILG